MGFDDADAGDARFGAKVRSALFWRSGGQIVAQMLSWVSTIYVMRQLDPGDYGIFAMTQVILNFMQFLNGYGLVSALVQAESLPTHQVRQAFGIMLILNAVLAGAQLALAPFAADYYNQPIVADLLRVQALIYLSTPFIAIPEVLMGRSLDFRGPAIVGLIAAAAAAGVAVAGAMLGWGVWTLIFAPIAGFYVRGIGYAIATGFIPIPSFDFRGTRWMIVFGASLLGGQLLWIIQNQADILIGGRVLSTHELGLYSESLFLTQIFVSKFIPPLNDVAFPAYARMQRDAARVAELFCRAVRILMLISCPLYFGMAASAPALIETLLGAKWLPMADTVRILALAMPFMTVQVMFAPLSNAMGARNDDARLRLWRCHHAGGVRHRHILGCDGPRLCVAAWISGAHSGDDPPGGSASGRGSGRHRKGQHPCYRIVGSDGARGHRDQLGSAAAGRARSFGRTRRGRRCQFRRPAFRFCPQQSQ